MCAGVVPLMSLRLSLISTKLVVTVKFICCIPPVLTPKNSWWGEEGWFEKLVKVKDGIPNFKSLSSFCNQNIVSGLCIFTGYSKMLKVYFLLHLPHSTGEWQILSNANTTNVTNLSKNMGLTVSPFAKCELSFIKKWLNKKAF